MARRLRADRGRNHVRAAQGGGDLFRKRNNVHRSESRIAVPRHRALDRPKARDTGSGWECPLEGRCSQRRHSQKDLEDKRAHHECRHGDVSPPAPWVLAVVEIDAKTCERWYWVIPARVARYPNLGALR